MLIYAYLSSLRRRGSVTTLTDLELRGCADRRVANWNKKFLPAQVEMVEVSFQDALRIRRIYRRLAGRKGSETLHRITVFIQYENIGRLLEFLGYPQEEQTGNLARKRYVLRLVKV